MFFEQIDRMMGRDADLILTIRKTDDGTLTVAAHTRMNGVEDEARHYIAPFTASGTPQELDTGFIPALAEPAVKTQGLLTNLKQYEKQLETARANSKALGFGAGCLELFTVLCAVKGDPAWRGGLALLLLGMSASMLYRSSAYEEKHYLWGGLLLGALGATLLAWFTFGS